MNVSKVAPVSSCAIAPRPNPDYKINLSQVVCLRTMLQAVEEVSRARRWWHHLSPEVCRMWGEFSVNLLFSLGDSTSSPGTVKQGRLLIGRLSVFKIDSLDTTIEKRTGDVTRTLGEAG